ncbi:MAG: sodium/glutamate symporter, partial [Campylobacteraceae bacterium]
MEISLNFYATLLIMVVVLLIGRLVIKKVNFFRKYDIPEPVVGGIIVAILLLVLTVKFDTNIKFNDSMKEPLMLAFYAAIGLLADLSMLKSASRIFVVFLVATIGLLFLQNFVGIGVILAMGENPLIGLLGGSISLTGGFGTSAAWGSIFEAPPYGFALATTVGIACSTFGLVAGGLMGGPLAHFLINRYKIKTNKENIDEEEVVSFEKPQVKTRLITVDSFITALALIAICLFIGTKISEFTKGSSFALPTFVWCLFIGVFLRNILSYFKIFKVFDREMDVLGNVSLSLFLAFSLMNIKLFDLIDLAGPLLVVMVFQVILMFLYGWLVTFKLCGKNYDSAVLVAGQCGFAIGSTYNAIANMQSITKNNGPSHVSFIIVPMVGAF